MTRDLDPYIFWKGISGLSQRFQSAVLLNNNVLLALFSILFPMKVT